MQQSLDDTVSGATDWSDECYVVHPRWDRLVKFVLCSTLWVGQIGQMRAM